MGYLSAQPSLYPTLDLKGTVLQNKDNFMLKPLNNGSRWCKVSKSHANIMRRSQRRRICIRRMSMKRSSSRAVIAAASSRRSSSGVVRRIRTLKKLVPNGNGGGGGLDELFGETADYIKCLQMKVNILQMTINLLSSRFD